MYRRKSICLTNRRKPSINLRAHKLHLNSRLIAGIIPIYSSTDTQLHLSRLATKWDDKWYTGSATKLSLDELQKPEVQQFHEHHGMYPSHTITYDDGDKHAANLFGPRHQQKATNEGGDTLPIYAAASTTRSGSGYTITLHQTGHKASEITLARTVASSFIAETKAGIAAIKRAEKECRLSQCRIIWILDCFIVRQALQHGSKNTLVQEPPKMLRTIVEDYSAKIDVVWISSHCQLEPSEEVDELPKQAENLPPRLQVLVPNTYKDVKAVISKKPKKIPIRVPKLPPALLRVITQRAAQVVLNQLYTETTPKFYPLSKALNLSSGKCRYCFLKDTVQHFFHCPGRVASRRVCFSSRCLWRERIRSKPLEVLEYMRLEGVLT